jgi:hypothetical protein
MRDDFISLFVRGCWLTSFFFTPIYMFLLIFIVLYGSKKGTLVAYQTFWNYQFYYNLQSLIKHFNGAFNFRTFNVSNLYRYQLTILTSRMTVYVLLSFWIFFFFFGEMMLLIFFNYSSLTDVISSDFFFLFKSHTIFALSSFSYKLYITLNFYMLFFISCAFLFLLNLKYTSNYKYLWMTVLSEMFYLFVLFYLFALHSSLLWFAINYIIYVGWILFHMWLDEYYAFLGLQNYWGVTSEFLQIKSK